MRTSTILALCLIHSFPAMAINVTEKDGGFLFALPDDFTSTPNPRKAASPTTQFSTHFSRESKCLVVPAGWQDATLDLAIDTTLKLASDAFSIKLGIPERKETKSSSGVPVTRIFVPVQEGDFAFLVIIAFSPKGKSAVTYTFIPGKLNRAATLKLVDATIESLTLEE